MNADSASEPGNLKIQTMIGLWKSRLRGVPGYQAVRFIYRLAQGTESRNVALLLLWPPKGLYQPYITTSDDRYPEIFKYAQEQIGDGPNVRVLSVGCSTGEEVFSLRHYFSEATIVGLDINPFNIAVCRVRKLKLGQKKVRFSVAASTVGESNASYDAIFAMALFRHGDLSRSPHPSKCDHLIRFADFEKSVTDMARILRPGGLLILHHAMFRFEDTNAAAGFKTVFSLKPDPTAPVYDREDRLMDVADSFGVVFQRID